MGNCLKIQQAISSLEDEEVESVDQEKVLKEKLMISSKVVKIRITKKQLAELLSKADMPVQQVLALVSSRDSGLRRRGRQQWRPALQSIPEVVELHNSSQQDMFIKETRMERFPLSSPTMNTSGPF
ncbi:hypothetical protein J5N97_027297 [Dioscorea zingiberensis]|uniref:Uncharacterized protein n=1 Tax=Dioscorea zingiberensis TaxID=325984 RepID=A0A9D5C4K2_9LILI|nr:hypothetical protein J5N97_027297 [Dioscorea zingiberensis]